jgi:hypothetical protein
MNHYVPSRSPSRTRPSRSSWRSSSFAMRNIAARLAKLEKTAGAGRQPTLRIVFCGDEETSEEAKARYIAAHPEDVDATLIVVSWLKAGADLAA